MAQIAMAWVLARGTDVVPLVRARRRDRLVEAPGAVEVALTPDEAARIERAIPPGAAAGDRYPAPVLEHMDSERTAALPAPGRTR